MGYVPNSEHSTAAFPAESKAPGQSGQQKGGEGEGPHPGESMLALLFRTKLGGVCLLF